MFKSNTVSNMAGPKDRAIVAAGEGYLWAVNGLECVSGAPFLLFGLGHNGWEVWENVWCDLEGVLVTKVIMTQFRKTSWSLGSQTTISGFRDLSFGSLNTSSLGAKLIILNHASLRQSVAIYQTLYN